MKNLITLFIITIWLFGISSATLVPYENFDWKLEVVFDKIDWIIDTNEWIEKNDVFLVLSSFLRDKYASWDLWETHASIFAYMLAYYDTWINVWEFTESALHMYSLINELEYFTCEMDSECRIIESDYDFPVIWPAINNLYIEGVSDIKLIFTPWGLPEGGSLDNEIIAETPKCIQSYCANQIETRLFRFTSGEKIYDEDINTRLTYWSRLLR